MWLDPWVSASSNARVTTNMVLDLQGTTVSSFFKSGTKKWYHELICDIFIEADACNIVQIPLSLNKEQDSWLWIEDENETIKSGYRLICKMRNQDITDRGWFDWLKLWPLFIPLKVKNFIWRVVHDCFPTIANLQKRKIDVHNKCPVYKAPYETLEHILYGCPFSKNAGGC